MCTLLIYKSSHGKGETSCVGKKSNRYSVQTLLFCHHCQFVCLLTIFLNLPLLLSERIDTYFPLPLLAFHFMCLLLRSFMQ